jgi:lipopolysaccharide/colanic/teichoic acid biosynthesis glycosyltransferase
MSSTSQPFEAAARAQSARGAGLTGVPVEEKRGTEEPVVETPAAPPAAASPSAPEGLEIHFPVTLRDDGTVDWDVFMPPRASDVSWRVGQRLKRWLDIAIAAGSLVLLSPFLVLLALLLLVTSGRPLFYACEYMGYRGKRFTLYKFRTMVPNAEALKAGLSHLNEVNGPAFKIRKDPRVTPLGRLLRRYSVDELPQLWNVLRGEMSMVGPRPPLPEEWEDFQPWQRGKLAVTPGITCVWQVEGRSDITDFEEWAALDLRYIRDWSLLTDVVILVRTIPAVLRGQGAY